MSSSKIFSVYIVTNEAHSVLYTGITNNLTRRIFEHRQKLVPGFTARYNLAKLVYYETFPSPLEAIAAEKRIKGWTRKKKIELIRRVNPEINDLADDL